MHHMYIHLHIYIYIQVFFYSSSWTLYSQLLTNCDSTSNTKGRNHGDHSNHRIPSNLLSKYDCLSRGKAKYSQHQGARVTRSQLLSIRCPVCSAAASFTFPLTSLRTVQNQMVYLNSFTNFNSFRILNNVNNFDNYDNLINLIDSEKLNKVNHFHLFLIMYTLFQDVE